MFNILKRKQESSINIIERNFEPQYLKDDKLHQFYCEQGYVVIKNCVPKDVIDYMLLVYDKISQMNDFVLQNQFLNSGRIQSTQIRNTIVNEIKKTSNIVIENIANVQNCEFNTGGSFQIKPASDKSMLNPHQDTPIIDEQQFYASYIWIPLTNMTKENGTLSVLPKSHLWGNHQRSLNVPWVFAEHTKLLWKYMQPIEVELGDVICFDSATIHASSANLSNELRLAYTTTLLPKNFQLVHYFIDENTPFNKVEKYRINEHFFTNYDIMKRPPKEYKDIVLEDMVYTNRINKSNLVSLIEGRNG